LADDTARRAETAVNFILFCFFLVVKVRIVRRMGVERKVQRSMQPVYITNQGRKKKEGVQPM
jgi:hypothetical protein